MITQRKIAAQLNLGRSTVSNILRNEASPKYNAETRRAVLMMAEKLGYRPNRASRSVRRGRSNLIGILHLGMGYEVARQAAYHISPIVETTGYELFVVDMSWNGGSYQRAIEQLVEARVEGVIICQMVEAFGRKEIDLLQRAGIPVVALSGSERWGTHAVYGDSCAAIRRLTLHLANLKHRRLLFLTNQYDARTCRSRMEGFAQGIGDSGGIMDVEENTSSPRGWLQGDASQLKGKIVRRESNTKPFDPGRPAYQYMRELIALDAVPDAILCTNDQWAKGAFAAAMEAGLKIPQDVAITGFDNEMFGAYAPYHLTTVAERLEEQCAKSVELITDLIQGKTVPQKQFLYPCDLIVRGSCGAPVSSTPPEKFLSSDVSQS